MKAYMTLGKYEDALAVCKKEVELSGKSVALLTLSNPRFTQS